MSALKLNRWCEIWNDQFITLSPSLSGLDLPGLGWHVTRATISNFKSFHGSYPQCQGGSDPVPAPANKYEMKHAIQSLLLLSTGIIQIPASCNNQDNDDGWPQHTSECRSRPGGNKDILATLPRLVWINSSIVWQYRNRNDSHSLLYSVQNARQPSAW